LSEPAAPAAPAAPVAPVAPAVSAGPADRAARFAQLLASPQPTRREEVPADLSVGEQVQLSDAQVRRQLSTWIMGLFGVVNIFTLALIVWLACADQSELAAKIIPAGDRVIDAQVIVSLLGASTVQLGSIAVIMVRLVFRPVDRR